jgi:hypothetical protein
MRGNASPTGSALSDRQRRVIVAIIVDGIPLDALAAELGSTRNALYKTMFDAAEDPRAPGRSRIPGRRRTEEAMNGWQAIDRFLRTDPRDVGCDQAMEILDIYVDAVVKDGAGATEGRYPGVAAHLRLRPLRRGLRRPARSRDGGSLMTSRRSHRWSSRSRRTHG